MSVVDLKEYTTRAVELESAIYTQKKLMKEHEEEIRKQRPVAPTECILDKPIMPNKTDYIIRHVSSPTLPIIAVVVVIIAILVIYSDCVFDHLGLGTILWIVLGILGVWFLIAAWKDKKKNENLQRKKNIEYEAAWENYKKLLIAYKNDSSNAHAQHLKRMEEFNLQDRNYIREAEIMIKKHNDALASLEAVLQEHYNQNVIFPKYRDMVAIITINEYLMSGRCYELEGPNGAYNLYETELRQNVIIGQLSSIINGLEQLKNNQFTLYQELVKANRTVNSILHEVEGVRENTKLTAYFAGITALIEASPKVYIGHTF
ncbi:MAG: hypothetical protein IJP04_12910 [Clostridia bacterium]|nr:hypothetical protein [Clostridia bacterium]